MATHPRLSAITLAVSDMAASLEFYEVLGGVVTHGGPDSPFTSIRIGGTDLHDGSFLNLQLRAEPVVGGWGRWILHVADPDAVHGRMVEAGLRPDAAPSDAPWGERYFHVRDPDGHELSVSRPLV